MRKDSCKRKAELKLEGNKAYTIKDYDTAILMYNLVTSYFGADFVCTCSVANAISFTLFWTSPNSSKATGKLSRHISLHTIQIKSHGSDVHFRNFDLGKQCSSHLGTEVRGRKRHRCLDIFKQEPLLAAPWCRRRGAFGRPGMHQVMA